MPLAGRLTSRYERRRLCNRSQLLVTVAKLRSVVLPLRLPVRDELSTGQRLWYGLVCFFQSVQYRL